jgi:hypothetical protein
LTISSETAKVTRAGNGVATSFSFSPLVIFEPDPNGDGLHDLEVTKVVVATGVETVITEGTGTSNFAVVMTAGYPGVGSITFPASGSTLLASGENLVIKRKLKLLQPIDLENQGGYFPDTLEQGLDRPLMIAIQQQEELDRAVKVPIGSTDTPEDLLQSIEDDVAAAAASAAAAATAETNAETAEANAELAEANAEAAALQAAASATAAAAAAASGLFAAITDKSADFTIVADTDNSTLFKVDTSGGNINATLPSIATAGEGERYGFTRTSASNTLTLVRNGSDTINGAAGNYTVPAVAGEIVLIVADDAAPDNWIVIRWSLVQADGTTLSQTGNTISLNLANDQTWTGSQRAAVTSDNDGSFDMAAGNDFTWTPTGADVLEFTNETQGQRGMILLNNTANYAITFGSEVEIDADAATNLSATGKYMLSYWCYDGTNVAVAYSGALT